MKVLIVSHNPFSTYHNMGKTFMSLFSTFDKKDLCQLYIYPSFPNVDVVNSCFRITDRDAIRSVLPLSKFKGEVGVHEYNGSMIEDKVDERIYANRTNDLPFKRILRDAVWKMSHWYSKQLKDWLDREAPTCIFLAPGYAKFIYDIALKISKDRGIPIVTYICDDYYFVEQPKSLAGRYQLKSLQKKTKQILDNTEILITISEEIKKEYSDEFGVKTEVIMTGANFEPADKTAMTDNIESLSYFGNIVPNRERPLADLGRVLDEINEENNTDYHLKIYTKADEKLIEEAFSDIKSIRMCDFLVGEEFVKEFSNSDCLVHTEDFSKESIDLVKGSVSTKIADSLSSGIPMLAYGPKGIASIEHLRRNDCAFLSDNFNSLKSVVCEFIKDGEKRTDIARKALDVARKHHNSVDNSKRLKSIFEQLQEKI